MGYKPRLIILISSSKAGGAQIYIVNLVECLKDSYNIVVVCPEGFLYDRLSVMQDIEVTKSNIGISNIGFIRNYLKKQQQLYGNIIVNSHLLGTTFWLIMASFFMKRYRLISTLHQPIIYDHISLRKKISFPTITKFVARCVDEFIAVSKEIADSVFAYTARKAHYIPNSVPDIKSKKKVLDIWAGENFKIGIIGRLTPQKNHHCFLEAAKLIFCDIRNVHFFLIGDGELKESLKKQTISNNMEHCVTFTGFVNEPASLMKEMDIIVFSSDFEGTPLALLEAMNMGVPVVSTAVGGIPQVIQDTVDGILVPPRNPVSIKNAVLKLYKDRELYKQIHRNSIRKMQIEYSYEKNIKSYCQILNGEYW